MARKENKRKTHKKSSKPHTKKRKTKQRGKVGRASKANAEAATICGVIAIHPLLLSALTRRVLSYLTASPKKERGQGHNNQANNQANQANKQTNHPLLPVHTKRNPCSTTTTMTASVPVLLSLLSYRGFAARSTLALAGSHRLFSQSPAAASLPLHRVHLDVKSDRHHDRLPNTAPSSAHTLNTPVAWAGLTSIGATLAIPTALCTGAGSSASASLITTAAGFTIPTALLTFLQVAGPAFFLSLQVSGFVCPLLLQRIKSKGDK